MTTCTVNHDSEGGFGHERVPPANECESDRRFGPVYGLGFGLPVVIFIPMEEVRIPGGPPSGQELASLAARCRAALRRLQAEDSEVKLPLIIEFSGSPKSGKTTIIGIVTHFLKRMGADVVPPVEGASLRTPPGLRDDWLAFNAWSGCYALQQILVDCSLEEPNTIVILDRGLFDVAGWMEFLFRFKSRLTETDRNTVEGFFSLDLWRQRQNAVFLFTADAATSLRREVHGKLTLETGSVMNAETLEQIREAYLATARARAAAFDRVIHLDTSDLPAGPLDFQQIAFQVATRIVRMIEELSTQMLLVTQPVTFEGFVQAAGLVERTVGQILNSNDPCFVDRVDAERSPHVQQVVPYALLEDTDGKYFWARRRSDTRRAELRGRWTILVGGHAEQRDWEGGTPEQVFERCLRREMDEELIGLQVLSLRPIGFVSDTRSPMGSQHLAFIHHVKVGGRTSIRRQAIDKEFGRGSLEWRTPAEIRDAAEHLDPWSQLVAAALFGAKAPHQESLFTSHEQASADTERPL